MSNESQESFRDTTDIESISKRCQKTNVVPLAEAAFPSPPRIRKNSITRQDTDVEIESEVTPPGKVFFYKDKPIIFTCYLFINLE